MSGRLTAGLLGPAFAICLVAASPASGGPGDLDPSFSGDGKTVTKVGDRSWPVAVFPAGAGKVVAVGNARIGGPREGGNLGVRGREAPRMVLVRYEEKGTLDHSFGRKGIVQSGAAGPAMDATRLTNGDIVVAAGGEGGPFLVGFRSNGEINREFGDGGLQPVGGFIDRGRVLAPAPDGGVFVLFYPRDQGDAHTFGLLRLTPSGEPDGNFGNGGFAFGDPEHPDEGIDLAVAPDGRITVLSWSYLRREATLWRFTPSGDRDSTFSGDGLNRFTTEAYLSAIGVRPDGGVAAAANLPGQELKGLGVVAFTSEGAFDPTFSDDGIAAIAPFHVGGAFPREIVVQGDGGVVIAGDDQFRRVALARFLPDGRPDLAFGLRGSTNAGFQGRDDTYLEALAAVPGGKIVAAADSGGSSPQIGLARFGSRGPGDIDADGERDGSDLCPDVWGRASSGCPLIDRTVVGFRYDARKRFFQGRLESPEYKCITGAVRVFRRKPGRDRLVGTDRANSEFAIPYPPREGAYYALAPQRRANRVGLCAAARSGVVRR